MDAAELGAYMSLLIACYQDKNHCLPDDNARLARIAKCSPHMWRKIRPVIEEKFKLFDKNLKKYWTHERVVKDVAKYKNLSDQNSKNAAARWNNKGSSKNQDMQSASQPHSETQSEPQSDRNATQHLTPTTQNQELVNSPLTPQSKKNVNNFVDNSSKGVLKQGFNGEGVTVNNIMHNLDDKALQKAKDNASGWDIYHLAGVYAEGINNGMRDAPKSIKAAFPAWCKAYTKGKQP